MNIVDLVKQKFIVMILKFHQYILIVIILKVHEDVSGMTA